MFLCSVWWIDWFKNPQNCSSSSSCSAERFCLKNNWVRKSNEEGLGWCCWTSQNQTPGVPKKTCPWEELFGGETYDVAYFLISSFFVFRIITVLIIWIVFIASCCKENNFNDVVNGIVVLEPTMVLNQTSDHFSKKKIHFSSRKTTKRRNRECECRTYRIRSSIASIETDIPLDEISIGFNKALNNRGIWEAINEIENLRVRRDSIWSTIEKWIPSDPKRHNFIAFSKISNPRLFP